MKTPTFILANVLESESQARILSLNDADFAECPFAHHSQKAEMIEIDCGASQLALTGGHDGQKRATFIGQDHRLALGVAHVAQEAGKVFADQSGGRAMLLMASKADQDTVAGRIVSWNLAAL